MIRRLATAVAATTALVLASAAPALAQDSPLLVPDNIRHCEDQRLADFLEAKEIDMDFGETLIATEEAESAANADVSGTLSADKLTLDVELLNDEFEITAVGVKAGAAASDGGTYIYFEFPPLTGLTAPEGKGISHWFVCGVKKDVPPPGEEEVPPGEEEVPPGEEEVPPGEEDVPPGEEDEDVDEKPVPVPTEVPAGYGNSGAGSAGTVGLFALIAASAAGLAVVFRRRFLNES